MSVGAPTECVAAVVVMFQPGADILDRVATYAGQVDRVYACDNSDRPDAPLRERMREDGVTVLDMGGNRGVAAALNAGCRAAAADGYAWALTLDDDSEATAGLVAGLLRCAEETRDPLVAMAAPVIRIEGGVDEPLGAACADVDFAITSGCLLRLDAHERLGGFREDFFIDHVDTEFCFRVLHAGMRIVQRRDAVLTHRIGRLEERTFPRRHFVTNHSATRRYYMARNALEVRRLYGAEHPGWVAALRREWLRAIPKIVLSEDGKLSKLRHIWQGASDFRKGRFGTYEDLHPTWDRRRHR